MSEDKSYLFKMKADKTNTIGQLKFYFILSGGLFILDQLTKRLIENGTINLSFLYNEGAVLGLFRNISSNIRIPMFAVISVAALSFILYYMFTLDLREKFTMLGLSLILGGALGNFFDRIIFGKVLDFIDVGFWPTFNIADACISTGVAILLIKTLIIDSLKKDNKNNIEEK